MENNSVRIGGILYLKKDPIYIVRGKNRICNLVQLKVRNIPTCPTAQVLYGSSLSILVEESMQDDVGSRTSSAIPLSLFLSLFLSFSRRLSYIFCQSITNTWVHTHKMPLDIRPLLRGEDPCSCLFEKASVCPCKVEKKEALSHERNDRTVDSQQPNEIRYR